MSRGDMARLFLKYKDRYLELPLVEETLRWQSQLVRREGTLEAQRQPVLSNGEKVTGGFTVRVEQKSFPQLLALILGSEYFLGHVAETRSLFHHGLSLNLDSHNPLFTVVIHRGAQWIQYESLEVVGFCIRATVDECMIVRVDVSGESRSVLTDWTAPQKPEAFLFYYYRRGNWTLNGQAIDEVYQYEIAVERFDRGWKLSVILFSSNEDFLTAIEPGQRIRLNGYFEIQQEWEPGRKPYFIVDLDNLLLGKEAGQVRGSGEIIGPWYLEGNSDMHSVVMTREERYLL